VDDGELLTLLKYAKLVSTNPTVVTPEAHWSKPATSDCMAEPTSKAEGVGRGEKIPSPLVVPTSQNLKNLFLIFTQLSSIRLLPGEN